MHYKAARRLIRRTALIVALVFGWSASAGPTLQAVASSSPNPGKVRVLSAQEMESIMGAVGATAAGGSAYPWEGMAGGVKTTNGNKLTSIPIVGWTARGGMPVQFTLFHSSRGSGANELGWKWSHSFKISLAAHDTSGWVAIFGDGTSYHFPQNINGTYSPMTGIYDTFVANGSPVTSYDLTTKHGIKYRFTQPNGTGWHCTAISDRNGNTISISHNASNQVSSIGDPTSRSIALGYTSGKLTSITDPLSRSWALSFDGNDDLWKITYPTVGGNSYYEEFGYTSHNITTFQDKRGNDWTASFNTDGSIAWEKDPLLNQTSYSYATNQTTITDANGRTVKHNYTSGKLTSVVDQLNNTESYGYDSNNNRTSTVDRRGKTWSRTVDSMGNVLTETSPLNHTVTWTWNSLNLPLTRTDHLNHEREWTYNSYGNCVSEIDALGHTVSHTVDSYGQRTTTTNAISKTVTYGRDTHGYIDEVTDPNSNVTSATFNALGWKLTETDGLSNVTEYTRDNWGRVTAVEKAGVTVAQTVYDANSNPSQVKDGNLNTTTTLFDAANRPYQTTNGRGDVSSLAWDGTGQKGLLSSKTNGNGRTTYFTYTYRNEKASASYPDSTSESWSYNANGQLSRHTTGKGDQIDRVYDDSGRLTKIDYPLGYDTTFSWDAANRRTGMVDSATTTTWTFDAADRLTQIYDTYSTVTYGYDNADRRTSLSTGITATWSYTLDDGGRMTQVVNPFSETTSWTFNDANLPTQQTFSTGATINYQYDGLLRKTDVWHKNSSGSTMGRYQYEYDAASNVIERTDNDGSVTGFEYDGANQLEDETRTGTAGTYSVQYTYDDNGNRLTKTTGGSTEYYSYDYNDKLQSAGTRSYSYDNNGNCTSVTVGTSTTSLSYDYENRLTRIDYPNSSYNTYLYNGLGLRVRTNDSRGTITYVTDGSAPASPVIADSTASYTTPGGSERRGTVSKFYHEDLIGSTRGITNSSQTPTDSILYDAFGMTVSRTGTTPTIFGFGAKHGYQTDPDSGLMLLGHRYYDASIGRFLTQDPIKHGRNWYVYCDSNPTNRVDPEGKVGIAAAAPILAVPGVGQVAGVVAIVGGVGYIATHPEETADAIGGALDWIRDRVDGIRDSISDWISDMAQPHPHRPPGIPWDPSRRPGPGRPDRVPRPEPDPRQIHPREGIPLNPDGTPGTQPYYPPINPGGGNDPTAQTVGISH